MNEHRSTPVQGDDSATYSVRAELSREMVRLYKEQFGRGPTKARTDFAGPDTVICTLEDSMTPAERSLAALGEHQRLRDTRMYFQYATEGEFVGIVERVLGRKVRAFISGMDTNRDVSAEIFYLTSEEA
ncbi:MAG TPA: Na-translocating system protein MpsC family protein [Solirubrobacterales bacterium]|nr:Na-translocating system protein MpsC family protein [Solirubrobacterales bacterium]